MIKNVNFIKLLKCSLYFSSSLHLDFFFISKKTTEKLFRIVFLYQNLDTGIDLIDVALSFWITQAFKDKNIGMKPVKMRDSFH